MQEDLLDRPGEAWCIAGQRLVFLDPVRDRYFCLPDPANRELVSRLVHGAGQTWHQPAELPRPQEWKPPDRSSSAIQQGRFSLAEVARAIWIQRRIEQRIAAKSLLAVLQETRSLIERCSPEDQMLDERAQRRIRAFEHARLVRSAADRCLPRSIALAICLATVGVRARVVIGVQLPPFTAHSWTQHGDEVLNDSVEEVRRFEPILVI